MGVYGYLRESMGVDGFSDVNQRQRVLRRTAAAKEALPSIYRRFNFLGVYRGLWGFMGVMGVYRCMGIYGCIHVSKGVYRCSWVVGCKSTATRPMKNRRCEGVIIVDLPSI